MTFDDGANGNPPAKPRGGRERPTLHEEELDAILRKVVERAKQGDLAATRLCLDLLERQRRRSERDRLRMPVSRGRPLDLGFIMRCIRAKVAAGELTLEQGVRLAAEMRPYLRAMNAFNRMKRRLKTLEEAAECAPEGAFKGLH